MFTDGLHPVQLIAPELLALDAEFSPLSMALAKVLQRRCSTREFGPGELSLYRLSRLLWAAFGVNRPELGLRTAPSAGNLQNIEIYAALRSGLYRYDAAQRLLQPVLAQDLRAATGDQDFVADAPLDLIYVATFDHDRHGPRPEQQFYAALDTGCISQNVYLFCAAEGLATVVRGWLDRPALASLMGLAPNQMVVAAQSVGFPRVWPYADREIFPASDD
jgi:SagB-type dehydrogenase family enzyme